MSIISERNNFNYGDGGQLVMRANTPLARAIDQPFFLHLVEQALERNAIAAFYFKGARDFSFADFLVAVTNEGQDVRARRESTHLNLPIWLYAFFLRAGAFFFAGPLARRASTSSNARSIVRSSGFSSFGIVALILSCFT